MSKLSDIIETAPVRNLFGRGAGYRATFVGTDTSATEPTKDHAIAALVNSVTDHLKNSGIRRYFFSPSGRTAFVLYHQIGGWCYDIIKPNQSPSTCAFRSDYTLQKASADVERHAFSYED